MAILFPTIKNQNRTTKKLKKVRIYFLLDIGIFITTETNEWKKKKKHTKKTIKFIWLHFKSIWQSFTRYAIFECMRKSIRIDFIWWHDVETSCPFESSENLLLDWQKANRH